MRTWKDILEDLNGDLDRSMIRTREVGNTKIPYLEGDQVIKTANRIFGHDGWSISMTGPVERFEIGTHTKNNVESVTYTYTVPVLCEFHGLLEDGTVHTVRKGDVGKNSTYSAKINEHEMGISGCATDALKRAMRHLGNQFGLTLYDKSSADFQAAMKGTTKKKTTTQKKTTAQKKSTTTTSKTSKASKGKTTKTNAKTQKTTSTPQEVSDEKWERALSYVIPETVEVEEQEVTVPEGGKTVKELLDMPLGITILSWLAGIRNSPGGLGPFEPNNDDETKLQLAIRHALFMSELSMKLTGEELELCKV